MFTNILPKHFAIVYNKMKVATIKLHKLQQVLLSLSINQACFKWISDINLSPANKSLFIALSIMYTIN